MAKKSVIARQTKRAELVTKHAALRKELKAKGDYLALDKLPKNASPVRLKNRCRITGRGRSYMRRFGISRIKFRELAEKGFIPGIVKASW